MDIQEVKERYRMLLDRYHSNEIDWNIFQAELFKLKQARAAASVSDSDEDDFEDLLESQSGRKTEFSIQNAVETSVDNRPTGQTKEDDSDKKTAIPTTSQIAEESPSIVRSLASSIFPRHTTERPANRSDSRHVLNVGDVLAGRFILQRLLGFGQCGVTWRAKETQTDNYVVVKVLPFAVQDDKSAWKNFQQAFRRAATLYHENICPIYRLERDERVGYFMVSAFLDAFSLDEYYVRYCRTLREFSGKAAIRILWPAAQALDYAHRRKTFHGSLKPQNILVGKYCGSIITDFQFPQATRKELAQLGLCTDAADDRPYRAPEVWTNEDYGAKADQFSLGVLAYQLLSGSVPFRAGIEKELKSLILNKDPEPIQGIDERQYAVLKRALSKNPSDRFVDCLSFIKELNVKESPSSEIEEKSAAGQRGPHFDRSGKKSEARKPYRAVLFGLAEPAMPDWFADESQGTLWPFKEQESAVFSPAEQIPAKSTFPYATSPVSNIAATTASGFTLPGLVGGSLAALVVGSAIALGTNSLSDSLPGNFSEKRLIANATSYSTPGEISDEFQKNPQKNAETATNSDSVLQNDAQDNSIPGAKNIQSSENDPSVFTLADLPELVRKAEAGDVDSQCRLGEIYLFSNQIEKDEKKALRFFRMAAKEGDRTSFYYLGLCYEKGQGGLVPDLKTAVAWYEKSADKGYDKARKALQRLAEKENSQAAREAIDRLGFTK